MAEMDNKRCKDRSDLQMLMLTEKKYCVCTCLAGLPSIARLIHEAPLHAGWEPSSTSPPQPRPLDLIEDPVHPLEQDLLGLIPVSTLLGPLQPETKGTATKLGFK